LREAQKVYVRQGEEKQKRLKLCYPSWGRPLKKESISQRAGYKPPPREWGKGGEMTQTLYAHINKKIKIKINPLQDLGREGRIHISQGDRNKTNIINVGK
jgi:hypothetical protein